MAYSNAAGGRITKANFPATEVTTEKVYELDEDVHQSFTFPNAHFEGGSRLALVEGQRITQSQLDAMFAPAVFTSIAPATGAAAGGTAVVIKGRNFSGAAGATVGGVAITSFKVVDETTITGVTAAHAAGVVDVVITDDSGNTTATGAFEYTA